MPEVVRRYTPPRGEQGDRSSIALKCDHCKCITWGWADMNLFSCRRCGLTFFQRAGVWVLRGGSPPKKRTPNPKG